MRSLFSLLLLILGIFLSFFCTEMSFAADTTTPVVGDSILYGDSGNWEKVRSGNFQYDDIPGLIVNVIQFLLAFAGSISVMALIYHSVKMQLASGITGDSSGVDHAKHGIKGALLGFVLSMSAWFLMTKFVELLSANI